MQCLQSPVPPSLAAPNVFLAALFNSTPTAHTVTMHHTATRSDNRAGLELTERRNSSHVFEFPQIKMKDKGGAGGTQHEMYLNIASQHDIL
jgi:hypothetical protein